MNFDYREMKINRNLGLEKNMGKSKGNEEE
jgi:hypothetical protein